jgi:hypothetical protein
VSAAEILGELHRRGVSVALDGDTLCLKPKRALDDSILARVREAKPVILKVLRSRSVMDSAQCQHCRGEGLCDCSTCGTMKPHIVWTAGRCAACRGAGAIQRRIQ